MKPTELHFDIEKGTLILSLDKDAFSSVLRELAPVASEQGMEEKPELHVTVLGFGAGRNLLEQIGALSRESAAQALEAVRNLAETIDWSFFLDSGKTFMVSKEYKRRSGRELRRSIVLLVDMPGMNEFHARLNTALPEPLEVALPHVTLFSTSTNPDFIHEGIGIGSAASFKALNPQEIQIS